MQTGKGENSLIHLRHFKPTNFVRVLNLFGIPLSVLYLLSMFVIPWAGGDFQHVQQVWSRWQGLNVGMLAFISSVIAFNISTYNANNQRMREFQAAKAFLPEALSELCLYLKESAQIYKDGWKESEQIKAHRSSLSAPKLPERYKQVFSECITHADPEVGDYLARILFALQVHDARIRSFVNEFPDEKCINPDKSNLINYFHKLAELQALVNKLFDFSRGEKEFNSTPLKWEDFQSALIIMGICYEDIVIDEEKALKPVIERSINPKGKEKIKKKIYKGYTTGDLCVSASVGALLTLFNVSLFYDPMMAGNNREHLVFLGVFVNIVLFIVLLSPWLTKKAEAVSNEKLKVFLDLPAQSDSLKFTAFSSFLSDQALGSFLGTFLIVTGKRSLELFGPVTSAIYVAILFLVSILLITLSFIRFISFFTKYHWMLYLNAAFLSAVVVFSFFHLGLYLAR